MANKTCSITIDMSYTGAGSVVESAPRKTIAALYSSYEEGIVAVPALAAIAASYDLAFGGTIVKATMLRIDNVSAKGPIGIKLNGAATADYSIDVGGMLLIGGPAGVAVPGDVPVTSATVVLTVAQVTAGEIQYWVFGDPV